MSAELEILAAEAIDRALEAGADDAFAAVAETRNVEFGYEEGVLDKVLDARARNLSIDLYVAGRYARHQTTDLEPARLRRFLREAVAMTRALAADPYREITPPELYRGRPAIDLDRVDSRVKELTREERLSRCAAIDEAVRADPRVVASRAEIHDGSVTSAAVSSNGFSDAEQSTICWLGSSVTLQDRGARPASDSFYAGATHIEDLPDAAGMAATALGRAVARLDSAQGPTLRTLRTTMLVDSRAAAPLIERLLRPATAAGMQQGKSFWGALLGKKAWNDKLNIVDDPLIVRGLASRRYDREGISAKRLPLVEAGVVRNIYVDTYYGRKAGMAPTTGTPSNVRVGTGSQSLEELLRDVGEGIYVTAWQSGDADDTSGDFSLELRGHQIEDGVVGRPVDGLIVRGNLRDLFWRLSALGNDPYAYAAVLAPSMAFADVDFSG